MMINAYEFDLETEDGRIIPVSLRLSVMAQMQLKKRWNETTKSTLFAATDDVDRFVSVMDAALKYKGNENEIQNGAELIDLMAINGMLGITAQMEVLTSLGMSSGIFSEEEKKMIDDRSKQSIRSVIGEADGEAEPVETNNVKNV